MANAVPGLEYHIPYFRRTFEKVIPRSDCRPARDCDRHIERSPRSSLDQLHRFEQHRSVPVILRESDRFAAQAVRQLARSRSHGGIRSAGLRSRPLRTPKRLLTGRFIVSSQRDRAATLDWQKVFRIVTHTGCRSSTELRNSIISQTAAIAMSCVDHLPSAFATHRPLPGKLVLAGAIASNHDLSVVPGQR
jgi:hypothetical protein